MSRYQELVDEAINLPHVRPLAWKHVKSVKGLSKGSDEVTFVFEDGTKLVMYHEQDCCEHVRLVDFELQGKLKGPLLQFQETAEVRSGTESDYGSETWTFYNIRIGTASLNMRWLGESNGYYSESVDLRVARPARRLEPEDF